MKKSELRSCKGVGARLTSQAWLLCVILLTSARLFAADQSIANKAWTVLEAGLHDTKTDKRVQAISALGVMRGDRKATQTAEDLLQDPDPNICRAAIAALGDMNSKTSLPKIKALIDHSDAKTVLAIAAVLTKFKDPEGYDIYYEVLTGKRKGGGSIVDGVKDRKALQKMGVETAIGFVPFGGVGTGAYNYFKQSGSSQSALSVTAVSALAEDPDPDAEKALIEASFAGKEAVQVAALRALAKRGNPRVLKEIEPAMDCDKSLVSYNAAAAILHLLDLRAKQPVIHDRRAPSHSRSPS
jgi:HEAT repeat protein